MSSSGPTTHQVAVDAAGCRSRGCRSRHNTGTGSSARSVTNSSRSADQAVVRAVAGEHDEVRRRVARSRASTFVEREAGVAVADVRVAEAGSPSPDHCDDRRSRARAASSRDAADLDAELVQAERQRGHRDRGVTDAIGVAVAGDAVDDRLIDEHVRSRPGARRDPADIDASRRRSRSRAARAAGARAARSPAVISVRAT